MIIHGDCLHAMRHMNPGDASMVLTDPPSNDDAIQSLWFTEARRIVGPHGNIVFTPGIKNMHLYPRPTWVLCWKKKHPAPFNGQQHMAKWNSWEPIYIYGQPNKPLFSDVIGVPEPDETPRAGIKPAGLGSVLLEYFSCRRDIILDPFMGTGSFGVAAQERGMEYIGIEITADRYNEAAERLKAKENKQ